MLRNIIRKHLEEDVLKKYFKGKYDSTTQSEKNKILKLVESDIENQIDGILNTFLVEIKKGSPEIAKQKKIRVLLSILTIILTAGLAHSVNLENYIYISIVALSLIIIQIYQIFEK